MLGNSKTKRQCNEPTEDTDGRWCAAVSRQKCLVSVWFTIDITHHSSEKEKKCIFFSHKWPFEKWITSLAFKTTPPCFVALYLGCLRLFLYHSLYHLSLTLQYWQALHLYLHPHYICGVVFCVWLLIIELYRHSILGVTHHVHSNANCIDRFIQHNAHSRQNKIQSS